MRTGMAGLALWSFLMASAHGAGLMLVPILLPHGHGGSDTPAISPAAESLTFALAAVGVHTLAMLTVTGTIAVAVYEWLGPRLPPPRLDQPRPPLDRRPHRHRPDPPPLRNALTPLHHEEALEEIPPHARHAPATPGAPRYCDRQHFSANVFRLR